MASKKGKNQKLKLFLIISGVVFGLVVGLLVPSLLNLWNRAGIFSPEDEERTVVPSAGVELPTVDGGTRRQPEALIPTPEPGDRAPAEGVGVPVSVAPVGDVNYRVFVIRGEEGKFVPNTIVANAGDSVVLHLQGIDGDYNLFFPDFGVFTFARQGESKRHMFHVPSYGEYDFYCRDICEGEVKGKLIVNPR